MQIVWNEDKIEPFPLYWQIGLGYHSLQSPNAALVVAPIRFVGDEQYAVLEMPVELADYFFATCDLESVSAKYSLQASDQRPLANLSLSRRVLNYPSDLADHIVRKLGIVVSDHLFDVLSDQSPIALLRHNTPALIGRLFIARGVERKTKGRTNVLPFALRCTPESAEPASCLCSTWRSHARPPPTFVATVFGAPTAANLNLSLSLIAAKDCGRRAISVEQKCSVIEFCASIQNCSSFI